MFSGFLLISDDFFEYAGRSQNMFTMLTFWVLCFLLWLTVYKYYQPIWKIHHIVGGLINSLLTAVGVLCCQPLCHSCFHFTVTLKSVVSKIFLQRWKQITITWCHLRAVRDVFKHSFVMMLYTIWTNFLTFGIVYVSLVGLAVWPWQWLWWWIWWGEVLQLPV